MTNRYRSSCCCDQDGTQGICFLGFGSVPKTPYTPRGRCNASDVTGSFNRHDNWSFCNHTYDENLCMVINRDGYRGFHPLAFPSDGAKCACGCIASDPGCNGDVKGGSKTGIFCSAISRKPIVAWYKHPYKSSGDAGPAFAADIPDIFYDRVDEAGITIGYRKYIWNAVGPNEFATSPRYVRQNTLPCGCVPHKYSAGVGCAADFYCGEGFYDYCGWGRVDTDERMIWWADNNGNRSYLSQSQVDMIGDPKGTGTNAGWRTSRWGYIPGGADCGVSDQGPFGLGLIEGGLKKYNSEYLYLQDILTGSLEPDAKLFRHFRIISAGQQIQVVPDYGFGDCQTAPYGLWPLAFTFAGVMHREKWYQQYWNSMSVGDVCGPLIPDDSPACQEEGANCCASSEKCGECIKVGPEYDFYGGTFSRCRAPKYKIMQCAGVPVFTHELVEFLDENRWATIDGISEAEYESINGMVGNELKNYVVPPDPDDDIIEYEPQSLAAYVMAAIDFGNAIHPKVTDFMEKCGILPDPVDYGEEQDYRIFKKSLKFYQPGGLEPIGHCCVNLAELANVSQDFPIPLHDDCDFDLPPEDQRCGWVGSKELAESRGVTTPWDPYTDPQGFTFPTQDLDGDGIPDGVECARFVCGTGPAPFDSDTEQDYHDFINELWDIGFQDQFSTGSGSTAELRDYLTENCCHGHSAEIDGHEWNYECIYAAGYASLFDQCGPASLCFDVPEGLCRSFLGGQFTPGFTCGDTVTDNNVKTCKQKLDERQIGSLCFRVFVGTAGGSDSDFNRRVHCAEVSGEQFDLLNDSWQEGPSDSARSANASLFLDWIRTVGGNIGLGSVRDGDPSNWTGRYSNMEMLYFMIGPASNLPSDFIEQRIEDGYVNTHSFQAYIELTYTSLANCEPTCSFITDNRYLNNRARVCYNLGFEETVKLPGPCPIDEDGSTYPCTNLFFDTDDFYFYGRPGEWRHSCPTYFSAEHWDYFFTSIGRLYFPTNGCFGGDCFNAQPYPIIQTCSKIPDPRGLCPEATSAGGLNTCTEGDCRPASAENGSCPPPLIAVCGTGQSLGGGNGPTDEQWDPSSSVDYDGEWGGPGGVAQGETVPHINYDAVTEFCNAESYSFTCFGAWHQSNMTVFEKTSCETEGAGESDGFFKGERYRCGLVNNAFFLRVDEERDENYCRDYVINYAGLKSQLDEDGFGVEGPGGPDDRDWQLCRQFPGNSERIITLVYMNQILGGDIELYGGCSHNIIQGDPDTSVLRDLYTGDVIEDLGDNPFYMDLFIGDPGGTQDAPLDEGGWRLWEPDADDDRNITVTRNDGSPSSAGNPYIINITLGDFDFSAETNEVKPWWGLVRRASDYEETGYLIPAAGQYRRPGEEGGDEEDDFTITNCDANARKVWPASWAGAPGGLSGGGVTENIININMKARNPGNYPDGLRDYEWYHAPLKREGPLPSAYYSYCWAGSICCNTKRTTQLGQSRFICDEYTADRVQGQPGSEDSDCLYERLPSNGEGRPDPLCGACPPGYYCCTEFKEGEAGGPRCIPEGTICNSGCNCPDPNTYCDRSDLDPTGFVCVAIEDG